MKRLRIVGLLFLTVFWPSQGSADIFTWTDRHGVTHLSNVRPPHEAEVLLETSAATLPEAKTSKKAIEQAVISNKATRMEPEPVAPLPLVYTQRLRVAGIYPVRYKHEHHYYGPKYYSSHYYRFPPWRTHPRLYEYDKHRILPRNYLRHTYIKKPHRSLHHDKRYPGVKHHRGHHVGRFSKRAYPHIGHLSPQPTIGHHYRPSIGKGHFRR
jgi:hypothetical protein